MKIYLVDDDSDEEELFRDAVHEVNPSIVVEWYDDVMVGLERLLKEDEKPSLIFLDLNIPRVSGKEFLRLLRQNNATLEIPVVIYSTSISKKDVEDTEPYNVKAYLQKPENFKSLCDKLREVIEGVS